MDKNLDPLFRRPPLQPKHIPKDYNFAAVDKIGTAYAYKNKPHLDEFQWKTNNNSQFKVIGFNFDNSNWTNSLISK
jgi:hypothetical protein